MTPEQKKLADETIKSGARRAAESLFADIAMMRSWRDKPLSDEVLRQSASSVLNSVSARLWHLLDTDLSFDPNPEQKWVMVFSKLDADVRNGGFYQYFWNTEGATLAELERGLFFVPHSDFRSLLEEAASRASQHDYTRSWLSRRWEWWYWKSYQKGADQKRLVDLDDLYVQLTPGPLEMVAEWIGRNFPRIKK